MNHPIATAAALGLCLGGCVAFEHLPAVTLDCDPQLAGRWAPADVAGQDAVDVDGQCRAQFPNGRPGQTVMSPRVQLRSFALDGQRYLVFEKGDIERMAGLGAGQLGSSDLAALERGMFLLRYRVQDDVLHAAMVDLPRMRDAIEDGEVPGREISDSLLAVTSDPEAVARLLRSADVFVAPGERGAVELRRLRAKARP